MTLPISTPDKVREYLSHNLVGQSDFIDAVLPFVELHYSDLATGTQPISTIMLLGPTGTGKTHSVELLAEALHGDSSKLLKLNCGEYTLDHEVAKLTGSPPSYLGYNEDTSGAHITQKRLGEVTTQGCSVSLVLFDEIEKASKRLHHLLLGILDKGRLHLSNNKDVDFTKSMIFMTSNIAAKEMQEAMTPSFGFGTPLDLDVAKSFGRLGGRAMQKVFDPEFINRIDSSVVFGVLTEQDIQEILELELEKFRNHIISRLRERAFLVTVDDSAKAFITQRGFNPKYGARELKRVIQKYILQPVAVGINTGGIEPGKLEVLRVSHEKGDQLKLSPITYHVGNAIKKPQNSAGKERLSKPSTADSA